MKTLEILKYFYLGLKANIKKLLTKLTQKAVDKPLPFSFVVCVVTSYRGWGGPTIFPLLRRLF